MSADSPSKNGDNSEDSKTDDNQDSQAPRRGRTPSIIVQSLGLVSEGTIGLEESVELVGDEENGQHSNSSDASDPKSSISNASETQNSANSNRGSVSSLYNSNTSPKSGFKSPSSSSSRGPLPPSVGAGNRRLSLNIGTTAPRRLSLNVDGLSSFANSSGRESPSSASGNATGSLRNKVALKPGHSLMGWINFTSTAKNLSGTNGKLIEVTPEELAKHNKEDDCWVALKDNVYNVTTYLQYHPGGVEELMRGAGRDATDLFNEVHIWVNYESILAKCLVGPYKPG